jgi:hypothetical protein
MKSLFIRKSHLTSAMMMTAVLSLSACGSKKEVYPSGPRGTTAQQEVPKSDTKGSEGDSDVSQDNDKDYPSNPSHDKSLDLPPPPGPGESTPGQDPVKNAPPKKENPPKEPVIPAPKEPKNPTPKDPVIPAPKEKPKKDGPKKSDPNIPIPAPGDAGNNGDNQDPNIPIPAPGQNPPPQQGTSPMPPPPSQPSKPGPPLPVPPPISPNPSTGDTANPGYDAKNPANVDKAFNKRFTGMQDQDGLYFVGTSPDDLLTYLQARSGDSSIDAGIRARNAAAARRVVSARLTKSSHDVSIKLEMSEGGSTKIYTLEGPLNESRVVSLQITDQTGSANIEASLKCLDIDGGCNTSMLKLMVGQPGSRSVVRIVLRESLADVYLSLPGQRSGNPEYETLREFWINSIKNINTTHKIKEVVLNSFEVVNGRAGFDVQVIGEDRQLMVFTGPSVAPQRGTKENIRADRSVDAANANEYDYDLANSIGSAQIINNNGLGQLRFALKMRPRTGFTQDAFTLTVMRIVKPILPLTEDTIK